MRLQISLKCFWFPFRGLDVMYNISFRRHQQFEFLKWGKTISKPIFLAY